MTIDNKDARIDTASRTILAAPRTLFRAFVDPELLANWRAPEGMHAHISQFDPREGGGYTMVLRYENPHAFAQGKTRPGEDEIAVRFLELMPNECIVEAVRFAGSDPDFEREMLLTTRFTPLRDGTKVSIEARQVPGIISPEDHHTGMMSALRNLARLTE